MIKEIEQTGLKYLCKRKNYHTKNTDHIEYTGSGKLWKRILKAHPEYTIKTTVLGLYDKDGIKKYGKYYSDLYNIVESFEWANLIPELGDGGLTHSNTHPFKNLETGEIIYSNECPIGFMQYIRDEPSKGTKTYYNPITNVVKRIKDGNPIPEGFIKGNRPGRGYGPKKNKTQVYHNGNRKIYVNDSDPIPDGFIKGVHYEGTTKNRIGCFNPLTGEKRYIVSEADLLDGFVLGLPPTTGKKIQTPFGKFDSVSECMKNTNLTRYQIQCNIKKSSKWFYIKE